MATTHLTTFPYVSIHSCAATFCLIPRQNPQSACGTSIFVQRSRARKLRMPTSRRSARSIHLGANSRMRQTCGHHVTGLLWRDDAFSTDSSNAMITLHVITDPSNMTAREDRDIYCMYYRL